MALAVTLMLLDEVDLQVPDQWSAAQVVLPYQAVERDRRSGSGIRLPVLDLGHMGQAVGELAEQPVVEGTLVFEFQGADGMRDALQRVLDRVALR